MVQPPKTRMPGWSQVFRTPASTTSFMIFRRINFFFDEPLWIIIMLINKKNKDDRTVWFIDIFYYYWSLLCYCFFLFFFLNQKSQTSAAMERRDSWTLLAMQMLSHIPDWSDIWKGTSHILVVYTTYKHGKIVDSGCFFPWNQHECVGLMVSPGNHVSVCEDGHFNRLLYIDGLSLNYGLMGRIVSDEPSKNHFDIRCRPTLQT